MSGFNEVTAIKALGISPMTILWPAFVLAFLLSLLTVWLNDAPIAWGRTGAQRVIVDAVEEIVYGMLRTDRYYNVTSSQFSIGVKRVEDRRLIRPTVTIGARGSLPALTIDAEEAELRADQVENVLKIWLRNARVEVEGRGRMFVPEAEYEVPLRVASRADETSGQPSCVPMSRIAREVDKQQEAIQRRQEELAATAAYQMLSGDFDDLVAPLWGQRLAELQGMRTHLCKLKTEPYRRWSAGFSCLCFVWVGAPMAIWFRNRDFLQSFFLCFAPILIVYYPLLAGSIDAAKNGTVWPVTVWTGNLILIGWGAWILRKVVRY
jgi:lipopolysaccharide export system permease protein